jgi:hypothetical protein
MRRASTIVAIYMRGSGVCANVQVPSFAYRRRLSAGEDSLCTSYCCFVTHSLLRA